MDLADCQTRIDAARADLKLLKQAAEAVVVDDDSRAFFGPRFQKLQQRLDGLGRAKAQLIGETTRLGPGKLNKRDRRALKRLAAGVTNLTTLPIKRLAKLVEGGHISPGVPL